MNSNNTQKPEQSNSHIADSQDKHTYRLLGESGLVEDEEGNILDASDLSDPYSPSHQPASGITPEEISARLFTPSKKNKHPDWVAMYDPRYCGPSLEAYVEEMEKKYRESSLSSAQAHSDASSHTPAASPDNPSPSSDIPAIFLDVPTISSDSPTVFPGDPTVLPHTSAASPSHSTESSSPAPSHQANESASNADNDISSDTPESDAKKQVRFHYSKRAVIFYIIGAIFLLFYFVLLIRKLINEIAQLF